MFARNWSFPFTYREKPLGGLHVEPVEGEEGESSQHNHNLQGRHVRDAVGQG